MQSVSSRIWTRVAVSISDDDNHYISGTSTSSKFYLLTHPILAKTKNQILIFFFAYQNCEPPPHTHTSQFLFFFLLKRTRFFLLHFKSVHRL